MVFGRFKHAVSDVAETIRRAFQDPPCRQVPTRFLCPGTAFLRPLEASSSTLAYRFEPRILLPELAFRRALQSAPMTFEAKLCREDAWGAWAAGAKVVAMPVFQAGACNRLTVPPLPRTVPARGLPLPPFRSSCRSLREAFASPAVRSLSPRFPPPSVRRELEMVFGMPLAIPGEDFQKLPRALNMRYSFQLVKATGENIRNLDVLGVFPVPVKGVLALRHDPGTGRILVNLGPEAIGQPRGRFLLARKKDDHTFVSCFVEE